MAIWYRASYVKNSKTVFSGDGGLHTAGRWNHLGRKVIYCSESISLCTLEWLSHHGLSLSGFNYTRYSITIPDSLITTFAVNDLPDAWDATPSTDISRDFAEETLFASNKHLAIAVPSVIVPEEFNIIINPLHADFLAVTETIECLGEYIAPNRT